MILKKITGAIFATFLLSSPLQAANFTVTTSSDANCADFDCDLQSALDQAENNTQDDTIRITAGTYRVPTINAGNPYLYIPNPGEVFGLTIEGDGAATTILDGEDLSTTLLVLSIQETTIRGLSFTNGRNLATADFSGNLTLLTASGITIVEKNSFFNNQTFLDGGAMSALVTENGETIIRNNLFFNNVAGQDGGAIIIATDTPSNRTVKVVNNTFVNNTATRNGGAITALVEDNAFTTRFHNNVFFNNTAGTQGGDIFIDEDDPVGGISDNIGAPAEVFNNYFANFFSACSNDPGCTSNLTQGGNITSAANPGFVNVASNNFHLLGTSPLVNAGLDTAPGFSPEDFEGDLRPIGAASDIGADELSTCGDGTRSPNTEACDDGNVVDGDGCSHLCAEESDILNGGNTGGISNNPGAFGISGGSCSLIRE